MKLYHHPRSPYSQKVLLAFYEKDVAFTPMLVNPLDPATRPEYASVSPLGKVPVLVLDDGWRVPESSIIIEWLEGHHPGRGTRLIPEDSDRARQTRFHDRLADLYLKDQLGTIFFDGRKPEAARAPDAVAAAHKTIETVFAGFDRHLGERQWVMGDQFTMADCSLIPALLSARRLHPYDRWSNLVRYAARAFERPSTARVLSELELAAQAHQGAGGADGGVADLVHVGDAHVAA